LRARSFADGEADHLPAEETDDGRQVQPTLGGPDTSDVADSNLVGGLHDELSVQQVRGDRQIVMLSVVSLN
jgi:hypothetical protein